MSFDGGWLRRARGRVVSVWWSWRSVVRPSVFVPEGLDEPGAAAGGPADCPVPAVTVPVRDDPPGGGLPVSGSGVPVGGESAVPVEVEGNVGVGAGVSAGEPEEAPVEISRRFAESTVEQLMSAAVGPPRWQVPLVVWLLSGFAALVGGAWFVGAVSANQAERSTQEVFCSTVPVTDRAEVAAEFRDGSGRSGGDASVLAAGLRAYEVDARGLSADVEQAREAAEVAYRRAVHVVGVRGVPERRLMRVRRAVLSADADVVAACRSAAQ